MARLESLALFRALDRVGLQPAEIPQPLLRTLFELDADCGEALLCLDRPPKGFNGAAMLKEITDTLKKLPETRQILREQLPSRVRAKLKSFEEIIGIAQDPQEAYNGVPGRDKAARS